MYIIGSGNISIQNSLGKNRIEEPIAYSEPYVRCVEPNFQDFFTPIALRRMSRIIKRSIAASVVCIKEAGIDCPDAIISGTGLGCIEDTEKFLSALIENEEKYLQPTFFIQSTHNTISSQIAIYLKCHSYNNTYSHRGISFEAALMDAYTLFKIGNIKSALVGGFDELTPTYFQQLKKLGFWKEHIDNSLEIYNSKTPGSFAGEGSISFMLSDTPTQTTYASIEAIDLLYSPTDQSDIIQFVNSFLSNHQLSHSDIDVIMTGISGDVVHDKPYHFITQQLFPDAIHAIYKNLSGEFFTAPAFGLWSAASCIRNQEIPKVQIINQKTKKEISYILLYNHYHYKNHSLILLSSCRGY